MPKFQRLKLIYALTLLLMSSASYSQIKICEEIESFHPIDKEIFKLKSHLQIDGVDTIIIYSHWIYTNGFNGYGKVLWKKNGEFFQISLNYNKKKSKIKMGKTAQLINDSILNFFFDNQLDTIKNNPKEQSFLLSHDGRHFISINCRGNQYCYTISNLFVQLSPENKRVQWINCFKKKRN